MNSILVKKCWNQSLQALYDTPATQNILDFLNRTDSASTVFMSKSEIWMKKNITCGDLRDNKTRFYK